MKPLSASILSDCLQVTQTQVSCWNKYLNTPEEAEPQEKEEEDVLMDVQQLYGNKMIDRCDF